VSRRTGFERCTNLTIPPHTSRRFFRHSPYEVFGKFASSGSYGLTSVPSVRIRPSSAAQDLLVQKKLIGRGEEI
jgi:hypothetical protein